MTLVLCISVVHIFYMFNLAQVLFYYLLSIILSIYVLEIIYLFPTSIVIDHIVLLSLFSLIYSLNFYVLSYLFLFLFIYLSRTKSLHCFSSFRFNWGNLLTNIKLEGSLRNTQLEWWAKFSNNLCNRRKLQSQRYPSPQVSLMCFSS